MGMTTVCGRLVKDGNVRTIEFKNNDTVFGGSRIPIRQESILCSYENMMSIIGTAHETASMPQPQSRPDPQPEPQQEPQPVQAAEETPRRRRRRAAETPVQETPMEETPVQETASEPATQSVVEYGINSDEEESAVENKEETAEAPRPRRRRIR